MIPLYCKYKMYFSTSLFLFTLIIAAILLTTTTTPTVAQNKIDGNSTMATDNMTVNGGGGENATETAESGSISSFHNYCPFSFC